MLSAFARMSYYAVARGRQPGIFRSWSECESQVKGFPSAAFKKFKTKTEAQAFIDRQPAVKTTKFKTKEKLSFTKKIKNIETKSSDDDDQGAAVSQGTIAKLDHMFMDLQEVPDASTSKSPKDKIEFQPPEPTTEKLYNGMKFQEDANGFVHVYTDGSCVNNGKHTAAAGFGVYFGTDHPLNASEPISGRPTNNAGEIQAAINAINSAQTNGVKRLNIFTDSQFLMNSVCKWMPGWKQKGWKLKTGKSVVNIKDFKTLDELIESGNMLIKWSYIPAHKGFDGNEEADKLAKTGASRYLTKNQRVG